MKLGGNEAVCFCLGYWPMFMCATAVVSWCLMSLIDVVLNLVKSKAFQTYTEWWIEKRCSQLAMGLFFAVWIVVGFHIGSYIYIFYYTVFSLLVVIKTYSKFSDSLRNNLRFTLPNTVGDREYYETPLAWYLIILFCVLYVGMCVAEILVLRSNANSGYVPPTVRPGSPKLDKSPSAEPIFVVLFDFDAKPPLTEEKLSLNKKPEDSPSSKDKESAPSSSSSKLESAFEFSSLRVPEVSSQSRPAEVVQHDTPKYQNGPKAKSAELKFISDETEKIFLDQSISV